MTVTRSWKPQSSWSRRGLALAVAGIAASALALGVSTPATASPATSAADPTAATATTPDDAAAYADADQHYAGSQVAKHEGDARLAEAAVTPLVTRLPGLDVSGYQGNVNWSSVKANGARFAYVKATEGTGYRNPDFNQQYTGSYRAGLIRGAYHFARPDLSGAVAQADYFVNHGGGWSRDGRTLPPMLDIEYAPRGNTCYNLSHSAMRNWIAAFSNEVHARTHRYPTIYTTTNWWVTCTGNWGGLGATNPLFIARYAGDAGTLPAGWGFWTIWQHADHGVFPGDQDYFNGAYDRLQALANG